MRSEEVSNVEAQGVFALVELISAKLAMICAKYEKMDGEVCELVREVDPDFESPPKARHARNSLTVPFPVPSDLWRAMQDIKDRVAWLDGFMAAVKAPAFERKIAMSKADAAQQPAGNRVDVAASDPKRQRRD
jgi:hypothetical protein